MSLIRMIALALAFASTTAWNSHPSESARDQYEAREDRPSSNLLDEATDHRLGVRQSGFIQSRSVDEARRKRSFAPSRRQIIYSVPYQPINVWKPPVYALSRPYFIPLYGQEGRVPIFFPPQAFMTPPEVVKDPYKGPSYLPPVEPTMSTSTTMSIDNRFNDDRPIWDSDLPITTTPRVPPTRRRRPPSGANNPPPLVHKPTDPQESGQVAAEELFTSAPVTSTPRTPPPQPAAQQRPRPRPNEPSRCVWATISCCTATNQISYACFEQRGCPGAFWDTNPCDYEFAQAAISAAVNYYNRQ